MTATAITRTGGKRKAISDCPGCYIDATGKVSIIVTIRRDWVNGGKPKNYERRSEEWPCSKPELRRERDDFRKAKEAELDKQSPEAAPATLVPLAKTSTLLAAVPKFIKQAFGGDVDNKGIFVQGSGSARARDVTKFMEHWCNATDDPALPVFGARPYNAITSAAITTVLNGWTNAGLKPWTRHHRRAALAQFYTAMNGATGHNPVRGTSGKQPKDLDPRGFDYKYVEQILARVPDYVWTKRDGSDHGPVCKAKIILRLECSTGLAPAELNRIEPRHLNLKDKTLYTWRVKGGAVVGARTIDLIPEAVEAFKVFVKENMFGKIKPRATARAWASAIAKANNDSIKKTGAPLPLPVNCRPYDLRHCYGSLVFERTGSEKATAEIMGHAPGSRQTARYIQSKVSKVVKDATRKVAKARLFKTAQKVVA